MFHTQVRVAGLVNCHLIEGVESQPFDQPFKTQASLLHQSDSDSN